MNWTIRFKRSALTSLALVVALGGCASSPSMDHKAQDPVEAEIASAELGILVSGCASGGFTQATGTLALQLGVDTLVLSAPNGKITANGNICKGDIGTPAVATVLTTTNVTKITITGTTGDDKVILDLLRGSFGSKIFGPTGGITVNFTNTGTPNDVDAFMVRGGGGADVFKFSDKTPGDVFAELTGDKNADVEITTDAPAKLTFTVSLGAGNDTVTGAPLVADMNKFGGANLVIVPPLSSKMVAHGGLGNDTFTGGSADDDFHGGAGNDTFKMAIGDDGSDIYEGDEGNDTVDYSNRILPVVVDIGPSKVSQTATIDLMTLSYEMGGDLDTLALDVDDNGMARTVTFANPTSPSNVVEQINTQATVTIATLTGKNYLTLTTSSGSASATFTVNAASANSVLGLTTNLTPIALLDDADDGIAGEGDDVRATVENITGGSGDDTLIGSSAKNIIKGGAGADKIEGGANTTCSASDGDTLSGEAGDDIIYMPAVNCFATMNGGTGTDTVDYSSRRLTVSLSNLGGTALDGNLAATESGQIGVDVEKMIGGFGDDIITGGANNDTLVGGPGNDTLSGAAGDDLLLGGAGDDILNGGANGVDGDTVDYSDTSYITSTLTLEGLKVSLCFDTTALTGDKSSGNTTCGNLAADWDGVLTTGAVVFEKDQILNVEHVIGSAGDDTMGLSAAEATAQALLVAPISITFEGGMGDDTITGGPGDDILWGDAGDDTLDGAAGDDSIDGSAGVDVLIGGTGSDICIGDVSDVVAQVGCEM